jgi:hypothetical protein
VIGIIYKFGKIVLILSPLLILKMGFLPTFDLVKVGFRGFADVKNPFCPIFCPLLSPLAHFVTTFFSKVGRL